LEVREQDSDEEESKMAEKQETSSNGENVNDTTTAAATTAKSRTMICKDYKVNTADTFVILGVVVAVFVYIIITNVPAAKLEHVQFFSMGSRRLRWCWCW
jgi:predicted transglutaminase-like protease